MTIERRAAAGLKWSSIAKLVGQAATWAITLVVFRLLRPEDYGLMALAMVLISVFSGVAELGLGSSIVQAATLSGRELKRLAGAIGVLNVVAAAVIAVGAPLLAELLGDSRLTVILRVLSIQFLLTAVDAVPSSIAYRRMEFKQLAGIELAATLFGAVTTLILAWSGAGVWALVFGSLGASGLRTVLFVSFGELVRPSLDLRGIGPHIRFGGTVTVTRFLWQLTSQADILVAGRLFTRDVVGLYSVSMHVATLPMAKVMGIINQVALPTVSRMQEETSRLRLRLLHSLRLLALGAIAAMWGLCSVAPEFVDVVLGDQWRAAILPLQLASLVMPLRMLQMVLATALTGVGRADVELRNTIVGALVLPAAFLIGARFGLNGLAISWLIAIPIIFAANFPRTLPPLGFGFADLAAAVRAPVLAGGAMYLAVSGTRWIMADAGEAARLSILILVGALAYLLAVQLTDRSIWADVRKLATALRA